MQPCCSTFGPLTKDTIILDCNLSLFQLLLEPAHNEPLRQPSNGRTANSASLQGSVESMLLHRATHRALQKASSTRDICNACTVRLTITDPACAGLAPSRYNAPVVTIAWPRSLLVSSVLPGAPVLLEGIEWRSEREAVATTGPSGLLLVLHDDAEAGAKPL